MIVLSSSFDTKTGSERLAVQHDAVEWLHQDRAVVGRALIRGTQLFNRQFRDMLVFVLLNQYADNFHERSERVRLVFSDFID